MSATDQTDLVKTHPIVALAVYTLALGRIAFWLFERRDGQSATGGGSAPQRRQDVNIALWVVQVLTALAFGQHGYSMLFRVGQARTRMAWTRAVSIPVLRFIGVAEILGAIGVILPEATGVLPWLTVVAAAGLVAIMALAILFHLARREWPNVVLNVVLGALAAFVLYGRVVLEPI